MNKKLLPKLLPLFLLAGGCLFAETHFSAGVRIGEPGYDARPFAAASVRPPCPGPGYTWVDAYRNTNGGWVAGYWTTPYGSHWTAQDRDQHRLDRDGYRDHDRGRGEEHERGFGDGYRR